MPNLLLKAFHRFCVRVYFQKVALVYPERLPKSGPVLYVGLHRNGAVDGFVYHTVLPPVTFMISTQLRKSFFGRLFFDGIEVTRTKDEGDRSVNAEALEKCLTLLDGGGSLFVFPEGTSSLGPRHLPFKSGAVQLALDFAERRQRPLKIVPLGIHYERAWAFRAKVEVVVGNPFSSEVDPALSPLGKLKALKRRMQAGLEEVGVNVETAEFLAEIEKLAYVSTLATPRSYFKTLKALELGMPPRVAEEGAKVRALTETAGLLEHQGVPLFPMGSPLLYAALLAPLGPVVLAGIVLNIPPFLAGWWAGKKFPDAPNVVSLWRILVGLPIFLLWIVGVTVALAVGRHWMGLALYHLLTWAALPLYYRVKKLAVAVANGLRRPDLRRALLRFREIVLENLPDET